MNHDELPITSHTRVVQQTPSEASSADASAPLEARLANKAWSVRSTAFSELTGLIQAPENSDIAQTHAPLLKKYLADSHHTIQDKALEMCVVLVRVHPAAIMPYVEEVVASIVGECVNSTKANVRVKGIETVVELSKLRKEEVIRIVIENFDKCKSPKTIVSVIQIFIMFMKAYGKKAFALEEVTQVIEKNAMYSGDKDVRNEALEFYKVGYSVFAKDIAPFIEKLKPAQRSQLEKLLQDETSKKASKEAAEEELKGKNATNEAESFPARIKPTGDASIKEIDIEEKSLEESKYSLESFDEIWCGNILGLSKWNEKRDKLEELANALAIPMKSIKLHPELIPTLIKLIADNNLTVAQASLKIMATLAVQVKAPFKDSYKLIIKPTILHLKNKRTSGDAIRCLESMAEYIVLDDIIGDIKEELSDKSPLLRTGLCQWLEKSLIPISANTDGLAELFPILASFLDDAIPDVRETALNCLAIIHAVSKTDAVIQKLLKGLPQQKLEKIAAAVDNKKPPIKPQASWKTAKALVNKVIIDNLGKSPIDNQKRSPSSNIRKSPIEVPKKARDVSSPRGRNELGVPKRSIGEAKTVVRKSSPKALPKRNLNDASSLTEVTEGDAEKVVTDTIPARINEAMSKADWKDRLRGFQELAIWIPANKEKVDSMIIPLAIWIKGKLKDFKENNQTIIKEAFTIISYLVESSNCNKKLGAIVIPGIIEKMGDTKWYEPGLQLILSLSVSSGPAFTVSKIIEKINSSGKNVNLIRAALLLLTHIIDKHESDQVPLKDIVECAKQSITSANPVIRTASTSVFCAVYKVMGEQLKELLSDLKEATLKAVELELNKVPILLNPTKSGHKKQKSDSELEKRKEDSFVSQKLIDSIGSPDINMRREALSQLEKEVFAANGKLQAKTLGSLMSALKGRMKDPCKGLIKGFVTLVGSIAATVGAEFEQYMDIIMDSLIENLKNKTVKNETLSTLDKIEEAVGPKPVIYYLENRSDKESIELRLELLNRILKHSGVLSKGIYESLIPEIVGCAQSKVKEVKDKAEKVLSTAVSIVGITPFNEHIESLSPTVKSALKILIAKHILIQLDKPNYEESKFSPHKKSPMTAKKKPKEHIRKSIEGNTSLTISEYNFLPSQKAKISRAEYDKTHRWSIESILEFDIAYLKSQINPLIPSQLFESMFSEDENKLLSSIDTFTKMRTDMSKITDILDLLFKWITTLLIKNYGYDLLKPIIELTKSIFNELIKHKYQLFDFEASSILPVLCEKMGDEELKYDVKKIVKNVRKIYPLSRLGNYLVRALDSHKDETKTECLVCLQELVAKYGPRVITARDIKAFGKMLIRGAESQVEFECAQLLVEIYKKKGEGIWLSLGELNTEIKAILKAKFEQVEIEAKSANDMKNDFFPLSTNENDRMIVREISVKKEIESIEDCLSILSKHNTPKQIKALEFIEKVASTELLQYTDTLLPILADSLHDIVEVSDYPIEFVTQYLMFINKICKDMELLHHIEPDSMSSLMRELLAWLLSTQTTKFGESKDTLTKLVNSSMISLLEKCSPNTSFQVLIGLYESSDGKGNLSGLIVKCILRLTKALRTSIVELNVGALLIVLDNYIKGIQKSSPHSETGTRVAKTIVNELVKIEDSEIWKHYEAIEKANASNDSVIKRWITLMLSNNKIQNSVTEETKTIEKTLSEIFTKLDSKETLEEGISQLMKYKDTHTDVDITKYIQQYSKKYGPQIMSMMDTKQSSNPFAETNQPKYM